jgi:hypothetical protein
VNGLKISLRWFAGMPVPWSKASMRHSGGSAPVALMLSSAGWPAGVYLMALPIRLSSTCRTSVGSPATVGSTAQSTLATTVAPSLRRSARTLSTRLLSSISTMRSVVLSAVA